MLAANLVCVASIVAWSGSVSFAVFTGLNTLGLLRVSDAVRRKNTAGWLAGWLAGWTCTRQKECGVARAACVCVRV